ncbi:MAG: membrane dipeptidase [candidate division WOR-3 bacterium]
MNHRLKDSKQKSVILFDLHEDLLYPLIFKREEINKDEIFKFNVVSLFTLIPWKGEYLETHDVTKVLRGIETYREFAEENNFIIIENKKDLKKVLKGDKKGLILEIEGCASIKDKYILKSFINLGVRVFTLTWNNSNHIASSCKDKNDYGLTEFGKEIVLKIVEENCIIDLAHAGRKTFYDVYNLKIPFIVSHTGILKKPKDKRNISYREMEKIIERGGIAGIGLGNLFFEKEIKKEEAVEKVKNLLKEFPMNLCLGSDLFGLSEKNIIKGLYSYSEIRESIKDLPENFLFLNAYSFFEKNLP